ncbi:Yip1 domain-containing protein [Palleronia marisminoris]|uniref:Yip1 domain protein n=1 Tax=Palleronia marisminoris TaxID=315423 RepID=A0A1Y5RBB2_9RHOB|nr:YIP1 family protein [Palleronia marisminoris]SFG06485.1 Yip1 domain-containing protein [Palleronia marisminoris]SLN10715.1 Yip1 domain protein [Palleronia marisminoris]
MRPSLNPGTLVRLATETLRAPRPTFAALRSLDLPRQALWEALLLVVVISVILAETGNLVLVAFSGEGPDAPQFLSPFAFGAIQLFILALSVLLIDRIGRAMGGHGRIEDAILAVTWLQFVMICLQIVQTLFLFTLPGIAGLILIGGLILFLYLLTAFVAELHGFESQARVFAMIFFVMMGVALGLSFILTLLGVTVPR